MPSAADTPAGRLERRVFLALMTALAVALNLLESTIPTPLPWVRPGLANGVTLLVLAMAGFRAAAGVALSRILLGGLLGGGLLGPAFYLSLGGGTAALAVMGLLGTTGLWSPVGVSAAGAAAHIAAQFLLVGWLLGGEGNLLRLLPPFLLLAVASGAFLGWVVLRVVRILDRWGVPVPGAANDDRAGLP